MFNDQSHIIYVNSQIKDETALGKLMHDFTCTNAKDMYYEVLADRVHYFKEDEKGVAIMCKAMEDMRNEAAREAEKMKAIRMNCITVIVVHSKNANFRSYISHYGLKF